MFQSALGAELLSQAFKSAPTKPSSTNPQKESIPVATTEASNTVEDENPSTSLPEEISTQEQNMNSPSVECDLIDIDTQTVNSLVQQTIDGKEVICLFYPSTTNMNQKIFLDVCRYQCRKFIADSTRYHWCIISCSFSSDRNYPRKGTVSPHSSHFQTTCYLLTKLFFPTCRYLTHQS